MNTEELIIQKIDINKTIENMGGFTQDFQILFLIDKGFVTPKLLCDKLGLQKTNLSLLCKKLLNGKLISKMTSEENHKQIAYCLTQKGKAILTKKIKDMGC